MWFIWNLDPGNKLVYKDLTFKSLLYQYSPNNWDFIYRDYNVHLQNLRHYFPQMKSFICCWHEIILSSMTSTTEHSFVNPIPTSMIYTVRLFDKRLFIRFVWHRLSVSEFGTVISGHREGCNLVWWWKLLNTNNMSCNLRLH